MPDTARKEIAEIEDNIKFNEGLLLDMVKRVRSMSDDHYLGASDSISATVWQHFKGGLYSIERLVVHSDDPNSVLVLYRPAHNARTGNRVQFVRPFREWLEHVETQDARGNQVSRPRFTPVSSFSVQIGLDTKGQPIALTKPFPD